MAAIQATVPGKEDPVQRKWRPPLNYGKHYPGKAKIQIRPIDAIYLDGPPEHSELCTIVWDNGRRRLKFVNRACPIHRKVLCRVDEAH